MASIVAEHREQVRQAIDQQKACGAYTLDMVNARAFASIRATPQIELDLARSDCEAALDELAPVTGQLADDLEDATPPAEIRALVDATVAAARALYQDTTEYRGCLNVATGNQAIIDCGFSHDPNANPAIDTMKAKLSAWDAYL